MNSSVVTFLAAIAITVIGYIALMSGATAGWLRSEYVLVVGLAYGLFKLFGDVGRQQGWKTNHVGGSATYDDIKNLDEREDDDDDAVYMPFSGFCSVWTVPFAEIRIRKSGGQYRYGRRVAATASGLFRLFAPRPLPVFSGFTSALMLKKMCLHGVDTATACSTPLARLLRSEDTFALVFDHHQALAAARMMRAIPDEHLVTSDSERSVLGGAESLRGNFDALAKWLEAVPEGSHGIWHIECYKLLRLQDLLDKLQSPPAHPS